MKNLLKKKFIKELDYNLLKRKRPEQRKANFH